MTVFRRPISRAVKSERVLEVLGMIAGAMGIDPDQHIFIAGTGRCGSSLLARILASHPEISVFPGEANRLWHPCLYPWERRSHGQLGVFPIETDPSSFTQLSLQNWPTNHVSRIQRIFRGYYVASGMREALVIKSAMISFMIPKLIDLFGNVKLVHIYRFGPSAVESYVKKNYGRYSRFTVTKEGYRLTCAKYWNDCILEIERVRNALFGRDTDRFFELGYEELCAAPMETMQKLASFIGVHPQGFGYDLSSIASTNEKVGDPFSEDEWQQALRAMKPAMELKGFL